MNITCHIAFSFSRICTCSHTLVAPHGLQKLGGVSTLIYASDVLIIIEILFIAYIKEELSIIFGVQNLIFFYSYKSLSWLSSITKKGEIESVFAPYVGFAVLMTSNLGINEILMRYIAALVP